MPPKAKNTLGGGRGGARRNPPAAAPALTPARLAALLANAVAALERADRAVRSGDAAAAASETARATSAVDGLQRACGAVSDVFGACWAGAGLVPLPARSAEVDAALDALARLIAGGCVPVEGAPGVALVALQAVAALSFMAPRRAAVLARRGALMRSLAAALGVRGDARLLEHASLVSMEILLHVCTSLQRRRRGATARPPPPCSRLPLPLPARLLRWKRWGRSSPCRQHLSCKRSLRSRRCSKPAQSAAGSA